MTPIAREKKVYVFRNVLRSNVLISCILNLFAIHFCCSLSKSFSMYVHTRVEFVNRPDPRLISCRKRFVKDRANGDKRSLRDSTAIRRETGQRQQKLRDRVKVISREAKREMLRGEKTGDRSGREEGGGGGEEKGKEEEMREHSPRSDRGNLFKRFGRQT